MTTDKLASIAAAESEKALRLIGTPGTLKNHARYAKILNALRAATAAAQELERRAAGVEPPKVG